MRWPTETKVWAATSGTAVGVTLATLVVWLLGVLWGAPADALHANDALAAVPSPVIGVVMLGIPAGASFAAGWWAKHTSRGKSAEMPYMGGGTPTPAPEPQPDPVLPAETPVTTETTETTAAEESTPVSAS